MAVRDLKNPNNLKITVLTKKRKHRNAEMFSGCDMPSDPFGINGCVSFWDNLTNRIRVIPLRNVEYFEMYEEG